MMPLRRARINEEKELTYPEGVACATVLETGSSESGAGIMMIVKGLVVGGIVKSPVKWIGFTAGERRGGGGQDRR
ncbi:MAG: hypothetical protein M2R45_00026 [Verrucomicrobia subdivision 3 bacterium]|nr:hypothetical protein [Limisphaerales bacterium]MCS1412515.1 hypothetical protein [Limisphaerales bacterium]